MYFLLRYGHSLLEEARLEKRELWVISGTAETCTTVHKLLNINLKLKLHVTNSKYFLIVSEIITHNCVNDFTTCVTN